MASGALFSFHRSWQWHRHRDAPPITSRSTQRNHYSRNFRTAAKFAASRSRGNIGLEPVRLGQPSARCCGPTPSREKCAFATPTKSLCSEALELRRGRRSFRFLLPAWRNWQTRWTQNPVIARSCGFEPLRRHNSWALDVERRAFDAWQRVFVCVLATNSERCLDFARHDDLVRSCRHEPPPAVFTPGCIRSAGKFDCADAGGVLIAALLYIALTYWWPN